MATETRSDLPSSRAEAKRLGYKHYFTGKPCKHGHVDTRITGSGRCRSCNQNTAKRWRRENPEGEARIRKRRKPKHSAACRSWRQRNPDYWRRWARAHPHKLRLKSRTRDAAKHRAIPAWTTPADRAKMEQFYRVADGLGRRYNEPHEVDHVVPLQSDRVCGLHCPANLQVLPATQNASKGNRWDPDVGTAKT